MTNVKKTYAPTDNGAKDTLPQKKKPVSIKDSDLVKVKSNFHGMLFYKNLVTQEKTIWEKAGEIQIMSIKNLRDMKAQQAGFFKNQWIIILGFADGEECSATVEDICKSLIITQYYENYIDPTSFEDVCGWGESEIAERVAMLSLGAKENLILALNEYIKDGRLDSIRKIKSFEKALDCELIIK